MIKYVTGNLIKMAKNGEFHVIAHGCNCFCTMNSGIAKQIKHHFPQAWEVDMNTIKGHRGKLGSYTTSYFYTNTFPTKHSIILNMYTQYRYGKDMVHVDYDAVTRCFAKMSQQFPNYKIGIPKIGCGLAGGDWKIIEQIIEQECAGMDITVVEWDGTE